VRKLSRRLLPAAELQESRRDVQKGAEDDEEGPMAWVCMISDTG
jgi:hypothetical protein